MTAHRTQLSRFHGHFQWAGAIALSFLPVIVGPELLATSYVPDVGGSLQDTPCRLPACDRCETRTNSA